MNKAKSTFVTIFTSLAFMIMVASVVFLFIGQSFAIWIPVLLSSAPVVIFFASLFLTNIARTGKLLIGIWIPLLLGSVSLLYVTLQVGTPNWTAIGMSAFMLIGWTLYIFWYSVLEDRRSEIIIKGQSLPDFTLVNLDGESVSSSNFLGKPTAYLFYRGNWCPFCMSQIKELAAQYQEIEKKGGQVVFVSPQPDNHSRELANKLNIAAHFMIDKDHQTAQTLGIFHKDGTPAGLGFQGYEADTVMPTLVVTDANGIIRFADLTDNYRVRPEPSVYLKYLGMEDSVKV